MKTIYKRIMIIVILGALLIALPIEIVGLIQNEETFKDEAEGKMEYETESSGTEFNLVFSSMDSLVNMMQVLVSNTFDDERYITEYNEFIEKKKKLGKILRETLAKTNHIAGLFVTFTPSLHTGREEIWYSYIDGKVTFVDARKTVPKDKWLLKENSKVRYYYDAIRDGSYWGGMTKEESMEKYMTSRTKSVYDGKGNLVGIVGANMFFEEVEKILQKMKTNDGLEICLFGSDMKYYTSSEKISNGEEHYEPLIKAIKKVKGKEKHVWFRDDEGEKLAAYTELNNNWILVMSQPKKGVMAAAVSTRYTLIFAMLLTITFIVILTSVLIRKYFNPIIESAEQNEIILINKSRQAKLGEMVGNVAHQYKQPLSSLNIDIANLKDDYYANELTPERFNEYTYKMKECVTIMSNTITDFANFLKPDKNKEIFYLRDDINKAISMMREALKINSIEVTNIVPYDITMKGYRNEFMQCMFNILENAKDSTMCWEKNNRKIIIDAKKEEISDNEVIKLQIYNTGEKITREVGKHIFDPYFSTKGETQGTGIGLYITKRIIENHFNGKIYYNNSEDGVTFTIEIMEE